MSDNNVKKLLNAAAVPVQDVENALQQLLVDRTVTTAEGEQLNVLGRLVGQARNAMGDDDYRRMIRARVSVNRSKGTISDVLKVANLVIDDSGTYLHIYNTGEASLVLAVEGVVSDWGVMQLVIKMLRDTVAAGVRIVLEFALSAPEDLIAFDTFTPGGSTHKGWGSTLDAAVGGKLGSAVE